MPAEPFDAGARRPGRRTSPRAGNHPQGPSSPTSSPLPHHHVTDAAMRYALELARSDRLTASLGPRVGCVLVGPDGAVVGDGRNDRVTRLHAETQALSAAGALARGATAVVTLEPCRDDTRAGSCAQALVDAGVRRVVIAQADPDPATRGGAAVLRSAGVEVVTAAGAAADEAHAVNRAWSFGVQARRPLVTWVADGGPSAPSTDLDEVRAEADTLLVSTWTALSRQAPRPVLGPDGLPSARQPLRVVMGTQAVSTDLPVFDGPGSTLHFATRDPALALAAVYDLGGRHVLLDGEPALAAELLRAGLVDEMISHVDPEWTTQGVVGAADLGVGTTLGPARLTDVRLVDGHGGRQRMRVTLAPGSDPAGSLSRP